MSRVIGDRSEDKVDRLLRESDNNKVLDEIMNGFRSYDLGVIPFGNNRFHVRVRKAESLTFKTQKQWIKDTKDSPWKLPSTQLMFAIYWEVYNNPGQFPPEHPVINAAVMTSTFVRRREIIHNRGYPDEYAIPINPMELKSGHVNDLSSNITRALFGNSNPVAVHVALGSALGVKKPYLYVGTRSHPVQIAPFGEEIGDEVEIRAQYAPHDENFTELFVNWREA